MARETWELFFLAVSALGSAGLLVLKLASLPSVNTWTTQVAQGWVGHLLLLIFIVYIVRWFLGKISGSGMMEDAAMDVTLRELESIEGCIENQGVAWRGIAHLQRGEIVDIEVPFKPICPNCQTGLIDTTEEPSAQQRRNNPSYSSAAQPIPIFSCPNGSCGYTAPRDSEQHREVKHLFESKVRGIVESQGEEYSLRTLVEDIDGPVTPKSVWEEYVEVVDDEQVSTSCFH